ncbi:MAG: hypothetical protein ABIH21_01855 [Patescibacteria group bacterium]
MLRNAITLIATAALLALAGGCGNDNLNDDDDGVIFDDDSVADDDVAGDDDSDYQPKILEFVTISRDGPARSGDLKSEDVLSAQEEAIARAEEIGGIAKRIETPVVTLSVTLVRETISATTNDCADLCFMVSDATILTEAPPLFTASAENVLIAPQEVEIRETELLLIDWTRDGSYGFAVNGTFVPDPSMHEETDQVFNVTTEVVYVEELDESQVKLSGIFEGYSHTITATNCVFEAPYPRFQCEIATDLTTIWILRRNEDGSIEEYFLIISTT